MFKRDWLSGTLLTVVAAALFLPGFTSAQDGGTQEVTSYVLTDAGLARYTQATRNITALPAQPSNDCDEEHSPDSQSLDQVVAKLNATPGVRAAIQSAGMTTREYVVFSMSVFHNEMAAWALS